MLDLKYSYVISPETILNKYRDVIFTADTYTVTGISKFCCSSVLVSSTTVSDTGTTKVYVKMRDLLIGATDGSSLLTGLTIPILLTQSAVDYGFYTPFNGLINQKEILNNFLVSADTVDKFKIYLYNTSDSQNVKYLKQAQWEVDWGDGRREIITGFSPSFTTHTYPTIPLTSQKMYVIKLTQKSPWGTYICEKELYVPTNNISISNFEGRFSFIPSFNELQGNWLNNIPVYDYQFLGDSENNIPYHLSSGFTNIPVFLTGQTKSRLSELKQYGTQPYLVGQWITKVSGSTIVNGKKVPSYVKVGKVTSFANDKIEYTIDDIKYYDIPSGSTTYLAKSNGITESMISSSAITKDETLLRIVDKPQVWSDVFIERGKNSALEGLQRLGEVDNLGDLIKYGYRFFNVKS
jgi:hypothetical protein